MYAEGDGIPQVAQALKWFILAAAPNHKDAIENRDQAILLITPRSNRRSAKAPREWKPTPQPTPTAR